MNSKNNRRRSKFTVGVGQVLYLKLFHFYEVVIVYEIFAFCGLATIRHSRPKIGERGNFFINIRLFSVGIYIGSLSEE